MQIGNFVRNVKHLDGRQKKKEGTSDNRISNKIKNDSCKGFEVFFFEATLTKDVYVF